MEQAFSGINYWAVLVAAISSFLLGGLWYSGALLGEVWQRETGVDMQQGHPGRTFGLSFVLALTSALVFAMFLGPAPGFGFAAAAGFMAGLFWVASSFGINYLFEQKSLKLWLVSGGYHTVQFTLYGVILGLWH